MRRMSMMALFVLATTTLRGQSPPTVHLGGFGDAIFTHRFVTGELDGFAAAQLSDRWSVLGDVLLQHVHAEERQDEPSKHFEADLERLYAAYEATDRLRIEAGQMHTGLVDWNQREHRSRFLQTPIDIPSIARGEEQGGAWPLHFVGVVLSGRISGAAGVTYSAGAGEARGRNRDEVQPFFHAPRPSALASLHLAPDVTPGLDVGVAAYSGSIPSGARRMDEFDETLSVSFVANAWEIRSEWSEMQHTLDRGPEYVTRGWYFLASRRWRTIRPYILRDRLTVAEGEEYLADVRDQDSWALGIRWDAARRLAFKADVRSNENHRAGRFQITFSF